MSIFGSTDDQVSGLASQAVLEVAAVDRVSFAVDRRDNGASAGRALDHWGCFARILAAFGFGEGSAAQEVVGGVEPLSG